MKHKLLIFGILALLLLPALAVGLTIPDGGVSYYNFSSTTDLWGSNDATNNGATSITSYPSYNITGSSSPSSYSFDGDGDNITIPNDSSFSFEKTDSFTISLWVKRNNYSGALIKKSSSEYRTSGYGIYDLASENQLRLYLSGTTSGNDLIKDFDYPQEYIDKEWAHLTITYDGSSSYAGFLLYINGVNYAGDNIRNTLTETTINTEPLTIGDDFNGTIDEVKIFNSSLNIIQINDLYNYGTLNLFKFTVSVTDEWNSSDVNNISVLIDETTYTNSTGNTITTNILQNDTSSYLVQVSANDYFSKNYTNTNVSSNLEAELYPNNGKILCDDLTPGDTFIINSINYTVVNNSMLNILDAETDNFTTICTSHVNSLYQLFINENNFNQDISSWDTRLVINMRQCFAAASSFNQDISSWNTSAVTDISDMFYGASSFNQDISSWNTSAVTTFYQMFRGASSFNQDISSWDVSNSILTGLFFGASSFNQDISSWDTSGTSAISQMFRGASSFNQDISSWDTSNFGNMEFMFRGASSFNQDISSWDVSSCYKTDGIFSYSNLSINNYEALLNGWSSQSVGSGFTFGADGLEYTILGKMGRDKLIDIYSWSFIGDTFINSSLINLTATNSTGDTINLFYTFYKDDILIVSGWNNDSSLIFLNDVGTYNITVFADGYVTENNLLLVESGIFYNLSLNLYVAGTVFLNFFDINTGILLSQNVNYTIKSTSTTYTGNTSVGTSEELVDNGYYKLTAESVDYENSIYYFTIADDYQNISIYMESTPLDTIVFNVIDQYDNIVREAIVNIQYIINGTTISVGQRLTDLSGSVNFKLDSEKDYTVIVSKAGYDTFTGSITPITTPYTLRITETGASPQTSIYEDIYYDTGFHYNNLDEVNFTFFINSNSGNLLSYTISTDYDGTIYSESVNDDPSGGLLTLNISPFNATIQDFFIVTYTFVLTTGEVYTFNQNYFVLDNEAYEMEFSGLSDMSRLIIATLVLVVITVIGLLLMGVVGGLLFSLIGLGAVFFLGIIEASLVTTYSMIGITALSVILIIIMLINKSSRDL